MFCQTTFSIDSLDPYLMKFNRYTVITSLFLADLVNLVKYFLKIDGQRYKSDIATGPALDPSPNMGIAY